MTALERALALMREGWSEGDAVAAVVAPLEAEIERLRALVVREREPRVLTPSQARALRALNRADVLFVQGDRAGSLAAMRGRGRVLVQGALRARRLITGKAWPEPQLTPAGWAWIEEHGACESCGGPCRGSGAV